MVNTWFKVNEIVCLSSCSNKVVRDYGSSDQCEPVTVQPAGWIWPVVWVDELTKKIATETLPSSSAGSWIGWLRWKMADDEDDRQHHHHLKDELTTAAPPSLATGSVWSVGTYPRSCQLFRFGSIRHFHNCRSSRMPCQTASCSTPIDIIVLPRMLARRCLKPDPPYQQLVAAATRLFRRIRLSRSFSFIIYR